MVGKDGRGGARSAIAADRTERTESASGYSTWAPARAALGQTDMNGPISAAASPRRLALP
jgi:hypothetical protein